MHNHFIVCESYIYHYTHLHVVFVCIQKLRLIFDRILVKHIKQGVRSIVKELYNQGVYFLE